MLSPVPRLNISLLIRAIIAGLFIAGISLVGVYCYKVIYDTTHVPQAGSQIEPIGIFRFILALWWNNMWVIFGILCIGAGALIAAAFSSPHPEDLAEDKLADPQN
jgi:hypothetical protein